MSTDKSKADQTTGDNGLDQRVRRGLENLNYPPKNWVPARTADAEHVHDIIIVGGGMCGMLAAHGFRTGGMSNFRILDRNPRGLEGPWLTYARMETLRSPKQLLGPAFGNPLLTFQAWFADRFGRAAWDELDKIPRTMWMDYLKWYREILDIPVENDIEVTEITPQGPFLRLSLGGKRAHRDGESILTRKLVMATGREGTGHPNIPPFMDGVPRTHWAHTADTVDFAALKNRRVIVVGIGASAADYAAEALEAGAREVRHLIRRKQMPTINKMMGIGSFGFTAGFASLPDEWRWRFMRYSFLTQTPAPRGSMLRVSRHKNAYFHFEKPVSNVELTGDGLLITIADGSRIPADYLILATGFTTDPLARSEFGDAAGEICLWEDIYAPPADEQNGDLAKFPYLNPDFTFRERTPGKAPWLSNIYCFNYGATASLGKVSGDIPGISEGASWLAREIGASLYREDIETHWQAMLDYNTPELRGDEWQASELPGAEVKKDNEHV